MYSCKTYCVGMVIKKKSFLCVGGCFCGVGGVFVGWGMFLWGGGLEGEHNSRWDESGVIRKITVICLKLSYL